MSSIPPAKLKYMEEHPNENRAPEILASGAVCLVAAVIVVAMRFISRRMTRASLGLDDLLTFIALGFYIAFSVFFLLTTRFGMGKHIIYISSAKWLTLSITIAEALYCFTMMSTKAAILMFYRRIFPQKRFHVLVWVLLVVVISYNLASMFATVMQCMPVEHQWDPSVPATCIAYFSVVIYSGVTTVVTDFIILGMPIPLIYTLQVSKDKKRGLMVVFSWGLATCIVSIVRTIKASALTSDDSSYDLAGSLYATTLELCMGIVAACVPTLRPLVSRAWGSLSDMTGLPTHRRYDSNSSTLPTHTQTIHNGFSHIESHSREHSMNSVPAGDIHVMKDYTVSIA
ncbi:hypothetical protein N7486_010512 [Penicillium sp. IBT 16267x]|nr:hypothetical protein N7486_010512 [Penicillium sp. IBT 16267x]